MQRERSIDIAKGLGILLVVLGHLIDSFNADIPGVYGYVYLFHVPLFFFISGLFYHESDSLGKTALNKARRLFVPYLAANVFFWLVEMARVWRMGDMYDGDLGFRDLLLAVAGLWPVPSMFSRPTWFLLVLFRVSILYKIIQMLTGSRKWCMAAISIAAGVAGALTSVGDVMIGQTLVALAFFSAGHVLRPLLIGSMDRWQMKYAMPAAVVASALLYPISLHQMTNIAVNVYGNCVLFFLGAVLGTILVLLVSSMLSRLGRVSDAISFVGRHTMAVLIWHVFIMKVLFTISEKLLASPVPVPVYIVVYIVAAICPCLLASIRMPGKTERK